MDTLEMKVRLYHDSDLVALCKVHYLGFSGMFIITDPMLFAKNTSVEVEFVDNAELYGTTKRSAVVTKRSIDGIGLTFTDINKQKDFRPRPDARAQQVTNDPIF